MIIETKGKLRGRYKLIVRRAGTLEVTKETGWFDNLILDAGLNRIGTGFYMSACQVGSSNVAPATTQTALSGYIAGTTNIIGDTATAQATAPYYGKRVRTFRFAAGTATGTLAEVGVGWTSTTGNLFSRALILDTLGNPTTITILSDEVLDVVYELRLYPDLVDNVFVANISGVDYSCVMRACAVTTANAWAAGIGSAYATSVFTGISGGIAYNGVIGPVTGQPSGTLGGSSVAATLAAYINNSYQRDMTINFQLNDANLAGGITAMVHSNTVGTFQISFSPAIPKDNTMTLTVTFRTAWARYTP